MNIFVTGATGRVGSRLVPHLLDRGDSVRVLVRDPKRAQKLTKLGAQIIPGDLLNPASFAHALSGMDVIIHLAAFFRGATPEESHAINLQGTLELAHAALQAGVPRFVFASTNLVYGPGREQPFLETDSLHPAAPYPKAKVEAEQALLELHRTRGLDLRVLRFAFVYGEEDPHLSEGLQWFRNWNPEQQIHMVHHADIAQAVMLAADKQGLSGQIFNVADDEPASAGEIMKLYDEPIAEDAASRPIDPAWHQLVDTAKIREQMGYQPIYPSLQSVIEADTL